MISQAPASTDFSNNSSGIAFSRFSPSTDLLPYVESIWHLRGAHVDKLTDRFLPDGHFELHVDLKDVFEQKNPGGDWTSAPRAFVGGMYNNHFFVRANGPVHRLSVVFRPGGLRYFLDIQTDELSHNNTEVKDIFGAGGRRLLDELLTNQTASPVALLRIIEHFLRTQLKSKTQDDPIVDEAIGRIIQHQGVVRMMDLAKALHISERHLRRRFKQAVGMSPKRFAKILRIKNAYLMGTRTHHGLREAYLDQMGYYDQSHFNREYKSIVGLLPNESFSETNSMFDAFQQL